MGAARPQAQRGRAGGKSCRSPAWRMGSRNASPNVSTMEAPQASPRARLNSAAGPRGFDKKSGKAFSERG
eukprot:10211322-Alexandrium_andersonii.AAC.1